MSDQATAYAYEVKPGVEPADKARIDLAALADAERRRDEAAPGKPAGSLADKIRAARKLGITWVLPSSQLFFERGLIPEPITVLVNPMSVDTLAALPGLPDEVGQTIARWQAMVTGQASEAARRLVRYEQGHELSDEEKARIRAEGVAEAMDLATRTLEEQGVAFYREQRRVADELFLRAVVDPPVARTPGEVKPGGLHLEEVDPADREAFLAWAMRGYKERAEAAFPAPDEAPAVPALAGL